MSYLSSLVLARAGEKEFPMLSSLSSSRVRAVVSLAGIALCLVGFFLPMFTESNPGVPGSAHPVYEWQVVMRLASSSVLAGSFAALSCWQCSSFWQRVLQHSSQYSDLGLFC